MHSIHWLHTMSLSSSQHGWPTSLDKVSTCYRQNQGTIHSCQKRGRWVTVTMMDVGVQLAACGAGQHLLCCCPCSPDRPLAHLIHLSCGQFCPSWSPLPCFASVQHECHVTHQHQLEVRSSISIQPRWTTHIASSASNDECLEFECDDQYALLLGTPQGNSHQVVAACQ